MELIWNPEERIDEVKRCIDRFGYTAEHNYRYFLSTAELGAKNFFLKSDEGYGILAHYREKTQEAIMLSEPLAPEGCRVSLLHDALDTCFAELKIKKFIVEQNEALRGETLKTLADKGYKALGTLYSLYWPVFIMERWTGERMEGAEWKKLRNIKNRFYASHSVEIVDSRAVDKEKLKSIVNKWVNQRGALARDANRKDSNFVYSEQYLNMIDAGFDGLKYAKTFIVDGEPCTITAGWDIPNSDNGYYSSFGVCTYDFQDIFEIANIEDLCSLKRKGYKLVEFGGSTFPLLRFKLKFKPYFTYITHTYTIVRK